MVISDITMFDGRDACGSDGWQVDDIVDLNRNSTPVPVIVTHLKPYTQYAFYIRTYTVASEPRGGITPIHYFRTSPSKPEPVTRLLVSTNGSSEIVSFQRLSGSLLFSISSIFFCGVRDYFQSKTTNILFLYYSLFFICVGC